MNINELIDNYIKKGYKRFEASSKVAQDIILNKIFNSRFKNNVTIKGGVVMHNISKDKRRATRDLDLDFIKYSLTDKSIESFISKLNKKYDDFVIEIKLPIIELHHQDYSGKRVDIVIKDNYNNSLETKLDIGIHNHLDIEQEEMFFNLDANKSYISLLANSCEQIFTEKLKSLLVFGGRSTRYKDIFDFYYLINNKKIKNLKLLKCFKYLIFDNDNMKENCIEDIVSRLNTIKNNKTYLQMVNNSSNNWLNISPDIVIDSVINYISKLNK